MESEATVNEPPTEPAVSVPTIGRSAPAPPRRHARKLAALNLQLRQQGAVIEELKAKLRHATERAEADERLLAEQAGLLVRLSRGLKGAVEELRAIIEEAARGGSPVLMVGARLRWMHGPVRVMKIEYDEHGQATLTLQRVSEAGELL